MDLYMKAEIYIPDGLDEQTAVSRTTHLAISAHQDDIEIMAQHGILACLDDDSRFFSAVVMTDGAGSPRSGVYADYTNEEMMAVRREEQKKAADIGSYSSLFLMNYPSADVKSAGNQQVLDDLVQIIKTARPEVIYTHNPADKHITHVGVLARVIEALRLLPVEYRPKKLYGCEVWRALDWVNDEEKIALPLNGHEQLRADLLKVFDSQIAGGKRYDLATAGRQLANATFFASHSVDRMDSASYAIDLTPLMDGGDIKTYILNYIQRFAQDVAANISEVTEK